MYNNFGKINILVVIIIVLAQVIIFGAGYFLFVRDATPVEPQRLNTLERTDVEPPRQRVEPRVEPHLNRHNEGHSSGFADSGSFDAVGKDYIKEYALYNLGDLTINLAGSDTRYLVVSISLEHRQADRRLPDELKNKTPIIRDRLISYFSRLTIDDIRNNDNREIFKDDIIRTLNGLLLEGRITYVVFEQFVFQ